MVMSHDHIVCLAELLAAHRDRSPSTVCRWASGDGALYARLRNGKAITTHRAARLVQWFSEHWPDDLAWPADVPRPATAEGLPATP